MSRAQCEIVAVRSSSGSLPSAVALRLPSGMSSQPPEIKNQTAGVGPGVSVSSLDGSWYGKNTVDGWLALSEQLRLEPAALEPGERVRGGSTTVLYDRPEDRRVLILSFHDAESDDPSSAQVTAHWHLRVRPAPDTPAPKEVEEVTQQHGGGSGLLNRLAEVWKAENCSPIRLTVGFTVDATQYRLRDLLGYRAKARVRVRPKGEKQHRVLAPAGAMWHISGSNGEDDGIVSIFVRDEKSLFVHWTGSAPIETLTGRPTSLEEYAWSVASVTLKARKARR